MERCTTNWFSLQDTVIYSVNKGQTRCHVIDKKFPVLNNSRSEILGAFHLFEKAATIYLHPSKRRETEIA